MKKLIYLLSFSAIFTACNEDVLEPFTPGVAFEENATRTANDLQRVLNSAQNIMTNRQEYVFSSIFTDEAAPGVANGGQGIAGSDAYYFYFLNPSSAAPAAIWSSNYNAMARVNLVLENVDKVAENFPSDAALVKRITAEAKILRALAHLKVLAYFSTDLTNDSALAGIIADRTFEYTELPPRSTVGEFYEFIHSDLDDAIELYTTNSLPAVSNASIYPTINLAKALKARAYAYKKDYVNAEIWADDVITNSGIALATRTQLASVFHTHTSTATTEVIFKFRRTVQQNNQGTNLHNGWVSISNSRSGSLFYEVSRSLYNNLVNAPGTDNRTSVIVRPAGGTTGSLIDPNYSTSTNVRGTDILVPFKHGGSGSLTSTNRFNPDFIQVRISEMYLIKAECRADVNDFTGVADALKQITDRRFTTPPAALVLTTPTQAWKAIVDERRKELAFEGHRFIDLKRLYSDAGISSFDRDPADYAATGLNFPGGDPSLFPFANNNKWALPIPFVELNANGSFPQNPGY
jgi:hypothetical protein